MHYVHAVGVRAIHHNSLITSIRYNYKECLKTTTTNKNGFRTIICTQNIDPLEMSECVTYFYKIPRIKVIAGLFWLFLVFWPAGIKEIRFHLECRCGRPSPFFLFPSFKNRFFKCVCVIFSLLFFFLNSGK